MMLHSAKEKIEKRAGEIAKLAGEIAELKRTIRLREDQIQTIQREGNQLTQLLAQAAKQHERACQDWTKAEAHYKRTQSDLAATKSLHETRLEQAVVWHYIRAYWEDYSSCYCNLSNAKQTLLGSALTQNTETEGPGLKLSALSALIADAPPNSRRRKVFRRLTTQEHDFRGAQAIGDTVAIGDTLKKSYARSPGAPPLTSNEPRPHSSVLGAVTRKQQAEQALNQAERKLSQAERNLRKLKQDAACAYDELEAADKEKQAAQSTVEEKARVLQDKQRERDACGRELEAKTRQHATAKEQLQKLKVQYDKDLLRSHAEAAAPYVLLGGALGYVGSKEGIPEDHTLRYNAGQLWSVSPSLSCTTCSREMLAQNARPYRYADDLATLARYTVTRAEAFNQVFNELLASHTPPTPEDFLSVCQAYAELGLCLQHWPAATACEHDFARENTFKAILDSTSCPLDSIEGVGKIDIDKALTAMEQLRSYYNDQREQQRRGVVRHGRLYHPAAGSPTCFVALQGALNEFKRQGEERLWLRG